MDKKNKKAALDFLTDTCNRIANARKNISKDNLHYANADISQALTSLQAADREMNSSDTTKL